MSDIFGPIRIVRSSEQVADAIRSVIVEGMLRPGERLPPERSLAERFRVTRGTVREALRSLEQLRLVSVRQGSGIRVRDYLADAGLEFAADLLGTAGDHRDSLMQDIGEARMVIGEAMAHNAVDRFDYDELTLLRDAVDAFRAEVDTKPVDLSRLQELDFEIQSRLIRAGGNRAIVLLHNSIRHVYRQVTALFEPVMARPEPVLECYGALVDALELRDRDAAKEALSVYFRMGAEAMRGLEG